MNDTITTLLQSALHKNNLSVSDRQLQQLAQYLVLLQTWNRVYNLTAITEPREMVYLHIIDSLTIIPYIKGPALLDIGSGAGLPGIPLAIMHPDQEWVLLDKNSKKTRFLTQAIAELQLKNARVVHSRCEDFHPTDGFDSILSRAYASISLFIDTTLHLMKPDGILVAMKGKYPEEELTHLPDSFDTPRITRLHMKGMDVERHVVQLMKKR